MIAFFQALGRFGILYLNLGIVLGFTFGALILLRPVTGRLLRPRHQVWLWFIGWYMGYMFTLFDFLGMWIPVPYTFRALVVPRVMEQGFNSYPMYISVGMKETPSFMLPGGAEFQLPSDLFDRLLPVIGVVWLTVFAAAIIWGSVQERRLRRLGQQGERMEAETMKQYGITEKGVAVRLCEDLPASFVRRGHDTGRGDKVRDVICLQKGLPQERLRLVLLHEMKHIELNHTWYKGIIIIGLTAFYWWNPILWLAYRLTCRDMELACDEAVLEELEPMERREYARTLVELGSGRHLWGNVTSFGECDAALRVRRAVNWKPRGILLQNASLILAVVLAVFFYCGGPRYDYQDEVKPIPIPEPTWAEYLAQGDWAQRLEDMVGQQQQVWSGEEKQLLVLDKDGQWYEITFSRWGNGDYRQVLVSHREEVSLEGCSRLT